VTDGPLVFVLGGGGSRGALQVGVLHALAEVGFAPDICVGTSSGALNAAMVAAVPLAEAADRLDRLMTSPRGRAIFRLPLRELLQGVAARRAWVRSGAPLRALIHYALEDMGVEEFADLRLPLHVVACNLLEGRTEVVSSGPLEDVLVASCSIPGLFPPVAIGDGVYVDGGVMENCGLSVAVGLRPARIVAVDVTTEAPVSSVGGWLDVVDRVLGLGQQARVRADFANYSARVPMTLLLPSPSHRIPSLEAFTPEVLSRAAAGAMREALPALLDGAGQLREGIHEVRVELPETEKRPAGDGRGPALVRTVGMRFRNRRRPAPSVSRELDDPALG
jgi:predicted acylesterase/phospholipase RssA